MQTESTLGKTRPFTHQLCPKSILPSGEVNKRAFAPTLRAPIVLWLARYVLELLNNIQRLGAKQGLDLAWDIYSNEGGSQRTGYKQRDEVRLLS